MKGNWIKYIFVIFVIVVIIAVIYKVNQKESKNEEETKTTTTEEEIVKEINLGVASFDTANPKIGRASCRERV